MNDKIKTLIFYILPHHFISWISYYLAHITWTPVKNRLIDLYSHLHPISLDDAIIKEPHEYKSLSWCVRLREVSYVWVAQKVG